MRFLRFSKFHTMVVFALLLGGVTAFAQTSKGTLTGVARDQTGAVIPARR